MATVVGLLGFVSGLCLYHGKPLFRLPVSPSLPAPNLTESTTCGHQTPFCCGSTHGTVVFVAEV